jgi:hypothetical protein
VPPVQLVVRRPRKLEPPKLPEPLPQVLLLARKPQRPRKQELRKLLMPLPQVLVVLLLPLLVPKLRRRRREVQLLLLLLLLPLM